MPHVNKGVFDAGNSGTALTVDWANGTSQKITLNNNVTLTIVNPQPGFSYNLEFVQDITGGRTVTFPGSVMSTGLVVNSAASTATLIGLFYDGLSYFPISGSGGGASLGAATGGTVTTVGNLKVHTFASSGNFVVTKAGLVRYLLVGGGGGSGSIHGGGGGAGGAVVDSIGYSYIVSPGTYTVLVGAGGTTIGSGSGKDGNFGGVSSFGGNVAPGGGGGGGDGGVSQSSYPNPYTAYPALNGQPVVNGSSGGGGGGFNGGSPTGAGTGILGLGGNGGSYTTSQGGGGGGAGAPGTNLFGGNGVLSNASGTFKYYGGGGAGGYDSLSGAGGGQGGLGGGGGPSVDVRAGGVGNNGTNGLGGGGGGSSYSSGGLGGSGVVVISYQFQ